MKRTLLVLALFAGLGSSISFGQYGIIDCVQQKVLTVPRIRGEISDASGVPIPSALVSITSNAAVNMESKTDATRNFNFTVTSGRYMLRASYPNFGITTTELEVGTDVLSLFHPTALRVILALPGMNCPWVTKSNKEFKELVHNHATQK
jgi:Carboxypeptidase regulatory-like domain